MSLLASSKEGVGKSRCGMIDEGWTGDFSSAW
jgi:hypothetical protein